MKIVADTNIFLAVALGEPEKTAIINRTKGYELAAPEVLPFELGNALTALLKRKRLTQQEILSAWDITQEIPVELRHINVRRALKIASEFNLYAYDAYFIECALLLRRPLLTLDRRMSQVAKELSIRILEIK